MHHNLCFLKLFEISDLADTKPTPWHDNNQLEVNNVTQNGGWIVVAVDKEKGHANPRSGGDVSWELPEEVNLLREIGKQRRLAELSSGSNHVASQKDKGHSFLIFQALELGRLAVHALLTSISHFLIFF